MTLRSGSTACVVISTYGVRPNRLERNFSPARPNTTWSGDITYIATDEGWLFLAVVIDLFSRRVVGWSLQPHMQRSLVIDALEMAWHQRRPDKDALLFHSDRGSQYCSYEYRSLMENYGLEASMSGSGNCYDNAPMESFWGSLKNELVHHCRYLTRVEAKASITEYIEIFYNRQRRHSRLGYLAPAAFTQNFNIQLAAA